MKAVKIPCEHDLLSKNHNVWADAVIRCKGGNPYCGADGFCHADGKCFADQELTREQAILEMDCLAQELYEAKQENGKLRASSESLIKQLKLSMNPIGTILTTTNSANPTTYLGGVWGRYGKGRTLVSVDEEDSATLMKTAGNEGGSTNPLSSHAHDFNGRTSGESIVAGSTNNPDIKFQGASSGNGLKSAIHSHAFSGTTTTTGDNTDHNNWQPFITVYFWRRTA